MRNIEEASMAVKCTALFQLATNVDFPNNPTRRLAGWSESWYFAGSSIQNAQSLFQGINLVGGIGIPGWCSLRAAMLPGGAAIVGQRYQVVNPTGPSQVTGQLFPGSSGATADIPQQAILIYVPALGANNIRRSTLRGIPDPIIVEGETAFTPAFTTALSSFFSFLQNFQFRARDLSQPTFTILNITAAGVVTCETPHTLQVGQMVRILRTRTADGDLIGGRFQVSAIGPGNTVFTLLNWTPAEATTGGKVRVDAIVFVPVNPAGCVAGRAVTRRVGRPFTQYRGRRSRRTG
jgi:hypothetical protein